MMLPKVVDLQVFQIVGAYIYGNLILELRPKAAKPHKALLRSNGVTECINIPFR